MTGFFILFILCFILAGTSYYLANRLYQGLSALLPGLHFWPILAIIGLVCLCLVLGFSRALLPLSPEFKHILGLISGYCMGIALYLLLFTVLADLLMLVPRLLKLPFALCPRVKGAVTLSVLLLTGITCTYGFLHARQIIPVSYVIPLSEEKQDISDLNVVMISDLHLGAIGSEGRLEAIVEQINALQPDVVCIAGDFFDTDFTAIQNPDAACKTIQTLHAPYGVYACLGNHDGGQTMTQMTDFLKAANIQLLNDAYTVIDNRLVLVGRLDASAIGGYGDQQRKPLSDFFYRDDLSLPVVVLDHNPSYIHEYTTEADLILCGHTHKGQVFPGNLLTKSMYTVDHGYYQKDQQSPHVIVSSGVGTWGMPMRVGTDCEIVTIRFSHDS